jgi:sec-independent protein translocase protein TatA
VFGFHWPELLIVLALAALIFGPKRLPEIGRVLGRGVRDTKKHVEDLERETGVAEVRDLGKKELSDLRETGRAAVDDLRIEKPAASDKSS